MLVDDTKYYLKIQVDRISNKRIESSESRIYVNFITVTVSRAIFVDGYFHEVKYVHDEVNSASN